MEKPGRIVQIGAPHGQFDAENTDNIFSDVLPSMFRPDADNIVVFEDAGVFSREEAKKMMKSTAALDSVSRARYEFDLRRMARGVPKDSYDVFGLRVLCDGTNYFSQDSRKYHLYDWLLERNPGISLTVTPESYPAVIRRQVCSQASLLMANTVISARLRTIEELLSLMELQWRSADDSRKLRDPEIVKEIERTFLAPAMAKNVKTNVMIVIGGYHDTVRHLSPHFAEFFDVEDRKCRRFANSDGTFLRLFDEGGRDRDALVRHALYPYLVSGIEEILAEDYKSMGSKKFKRDSEGKNVFGRLKEMCIGLPMEAIYKIFQSVLGIDCHVDKAVYRDVRLPPIFENFRSRSVLCRLVGSAEVGMETNNSEVNLFVERRLILHCLLAGFNVTNSEHRKTFEAIVGCLDDVSVIQMATEIRSLFYRERQVSMSDKSTILIMFVMGQVMPSGIWPAVEVYCRENKERVGALRKAYRVGNFKGYSTSGNR